MHACGGTHARAHTYTHTHIPYYQNTEPESIYWGKEQWFDSSMRMEMTKKNNKHKNYAIELKTTEHRVKIYQYRNTKLWQHNTSSNTQHVFTLQNTYPGLDMFFPGTNNRSCVQFSVSYISNTNSHEINRLSSTSLLKQILLLIKYTSFHKTQTKTLK